MAHAAWVPEGAPPKLEPFDGPAGTWIPPREVNTSTVNGNVSLERVGSNTVSALMGKAWRNAITGEVKIKEFGPMPDFQVADLWTRDAMAGTIKLLSKDPYIFRPIPMLSRTWMYHHFFRSGKILDTAEEDSMMQFILGQHCIDCVVSAGKWCPIMLYVPLIIFLTLAADFSAVLAGIVAVVLVLSIHFMMNTPELYRWSRPVTFPVRLVLLIWLILRLSSAGKDTEEGQSGIATFSFVVSILLVVCEIILGDGSALTAYRLHCSYEVLTPLPNRIFVCRRLGAAHSYASDRIQSVSEKITGMGGWREDYALIADVKGIIMELRPMAAEDWNLVFLERQSNEDCVHRFIGLDVYSPGAATIDALNRAIDEQQRALAGEEASRTIPRSMKDGTRVEDA